MKKGFTLIEMMIVTAIIGVLAAIAIPKFSDMINKSKEGATKGSLASLRSALNIYYAGSEGRFPASDGVLGALGCLTLDPVYMEAIPVAKLPGTGLGDSAAVKGVVTDGTAQPDNTGGWFYYDDPGDRVNWGKVLVNCTREDLRNSYLSATGEPGHVYTPWSSY